MPKCLEILRSSGHSTHDRKRLIGDGLSSVSLNGCAPLCSQESQLSKTAAVLCKKFHLIHLQIACAQMEKCSRLTGVVFLPWRMKVGVHVFTVFCVVDGRKWSCHFSQPIQKNGCCFRLKKMKVHLMVKKKKSGVSWTNFEVINKEVL